MAEKRENNNRAFVELEYCLDQYFSQHYAPIVNKEYKDLKAKQADEYAKTLDKYRYTPSVHGLPTTSIFAANDALRNGEWNTKHTDYLLEQCSTKFFSDEKVQADLINLKACCQRVLQERLGVDGYNKLAEEFGAPPEGIYVAHRFETLLIEHLARKDMPKSSLEYVMKKGFEDSLPGYILSLGRKSSDRDNEVAKLSEKMYNPSNTEKVMAFGVSFVLDSATIGGYGSAKKAATGLAWDAGIRAAQPAIIKKLGKLAEEKMTVDEKFSMELTGNKSFLDVARRSAKNVNPDRSDNVTYLNSVLNKKMFRPQFDYQEYKKTASALRVKFNEAGDGYVNIATGIASGLSSMGIPVNKNKDIPKWMEGKTDEECFSLATAFAAKAMEMKSRGIHEIVGKGKRETLEECAQKAYDYARVLQAFQRRKTEEAAVVSPAGPSSQQTQQSAVQQQQAVMHQASLQQGVNQSVGGWGSLAGQSGQTLSDFLGNGGKMLSMLPSLLSGMFTGKNGGLRFSDNLFSIGCILVGIFTKNKFMKMLFLALAGGNLLSKALGGGNGVGSSRSRPVRYREYGDEPLDPRISKPVLRGRTLVADIDGVPSVITINDEPVDAYEKGKLPLNTLANAVLRKYDEQRQAVEENYSRHVAEDVSKERAVAIR